jgi:hypothetical protein
VTAPALAEQWLDDRAAEPVRRRGGDYRVALLLRLGERVRLIKRCLRALELGRSWKVDELLEEPALLNLGFDPDTGEVWSRWPVEPEFLEADLDAELRENHGMIGRLEGELRARRGRGTRPMARRCEPVRDRTGRRPRERRGRSVRRRASSRAGPDDPDLADLPGWRGAPA